MWVGWIWMWQGSRFRVTLHWSGLVLGAVPNVRILSLHIYSRDSNSVIPMHGIAWWEANDPPRLSSVNLGSRELCCWLTDRTIYNLPRDIEIINKRASNIGLGDECDCMWREVHLRANYIGDELVYACKRMGRSLAAWADSSRSYHYFYVI